MKQRAINCLQAAPFHSRDFERSATSLQRIFLRSKKHLTNDCDYESVDGEHGSLTDPTGQTPVQRRRRLSA